MSKRSRRFWNPRARFSKSIKIARARSPSRMARILRAKPDGRRASARRVSYLCQCTRLGENGKGQRAPRGPKRGGKVLNLTAADGERRASGETKSPGRTEQP